MSSFESLPDRPQSATDQVALKRKELENEIQAARAHADDLEKNIGKIAESRAARDPGNDIQAKIEDLRAEIRAARGHADDLEKNIETIARSRASHR